MRGFANDGEVLVLIDGVPVNDGYTGGIPTMNIPIDNIKKIEVTKGSGSALYGTFAMGGVINIITNSDSEKETVLRVGAGSMGTNEEAISTKGNAGNLDYFINASRSYTKGYAINPAEPQYKNGMEQNLYGGKFIYHVDDKSKITLTADQDKFNYFYSGNKIDNGTTESKKFSLSYENKFDERSFLRLNGAYQNYDSDYVSSVSKKPTVVSTVSETNAKTYMGGIQYNYKLGEKDLLTVGYDYRGEKLDKKDQKPTYVRGKTETNAFYIQDEHKFNEQLSLFLGGRYDSWKYKDGWCSNQPDKIDNSSESTFNPKIALVYQANDKLTLRTSYGKAFLAPSIYQMAYTWTSSTGTTYEGNSNLKPEKSKNFELAADYQVDDSFLIRTGFFYNDVTDKIANKLIAPKHYKKYNVNSAKIKGFEISLNKKWNEKWNSFINYTYTDAKDDSTNKQLDQVPENVFNLGLNYHQGPWNGSLIGMYASDPKEDKEGYGNYENYFIANFKLSYALTDDASVSISVDNIFDKEYYESYLAEPRTFYMEFTKKF